MKLKYVGLKQDGETAFERQTGITWFPGDSHDIADARLAKRMLEHPDVFAEDVESTPGPSAASAGATAPSTPAPAAPAPAPAAPVAAPTVASAASSTSESAADSAAPQFVITTPKGDVTLDALDRDALKALADELDVKVHHATGAEKIRAALLEAFPAKK